MPWTTAMRALQTQGGRRPKDCKMRQAMDGRRKKDEPVACKQFRLRPNYNLMAWAVRSTTQQYRVMLFYGGTE